MIKNFFEMQHIEYLMDASLKEYNTYRIDARCQYLVFPKNKEELIKILRKLTVCQIPYFILGNGSNIILSQEKYDGVMIKLNKMNHITYCQNIVTAEAGVSLIKLALFTIEHSLSGLEFAAGIPGSVGGSAAMNAGAYKSDMASVIQKVEVLNEKGEIQILTNDEMQFTYRDSLLKHNQKLVVLSVTFNLVPGNYEEMISLIEERKKRRLATQPLNLPSAGSVFRNPPDMYAGELIEKCHLKGYNINGAEVSMKHANFIVNKGHATGQDIINLIKKVQKEVKSQYDVDLKMEQIII